MNRALHHWILTCAVLILAPAISLRAQDDNADNAFWFNKDVARPAAAAQVVGMGAVSPLSAFVLRNEGLRYVVWDELGFGSDVAPKLPIRLLHDIRDKRKRLDLRDKADDEIQRPDRALVDTLRKAMVFAYDTPLDAFKKSAAEHKYVTFDHLLNAPSRYRGEVIEIHGTLAQLRVEQTSITSQKLGAPKTIYEGWVFGETKNRTPICIQFPILPKGLEPAESMRTKVVFYGYFLATFKYEAGKIDGKTKELETPLLVGPTVVVESKAGAAGGGEPETPFALIVLGLVLVSLIVLSVVFFLMYFGFQRGDRKVLATLDSIKAKNAPGPFVNEGTDPETNIKASSQLVLGEPPPNWLPEAKPIDPEKKDPNQG